LAAVHIKCKKWFAGWLYDDREELLPNGKKSEKWYGSFHHSNMETYISQGGSSLDLLMLLSLPVFRKPSSELFHRSHQALAFVCVCSMAASKVEIPDLSDLSRCLYRGVRPEFVAPTLQHSISQRQFPARLPTSAGDQDEWWDQSHRDSSFQTADKTRAVYQPMDSVNQLLVLLAKSSFRGRVPYRRTADDVEASDRAAKRTHFEVSTEKHQCLGFSVSRSSSSAVPASEFETVLLVASGRPISTPINTSSTSVFSSRYALVLLLTKPTNALLLLPLVIGPLDLSNRDGWKPADVALR